MLRPKSRDGRRVDKSYGDNRLHRMMSIKKREDMVLLGLRQRAHDDGS